MADRTGRESTVIQRVLSPKFTVTPKPEDLLSSHFTSELNL